MAIAAHGDAGALANSIRDPETPKPGVCRQAPGLGRVGIPPPSDPGRCGAENRETVNRKQGKLKTGVVIKD